MPIVSYLAEGHSDPFTILISTLISLRTKDEVTAEATRRLFHLAGNPAEMLTLAPETIAQNHLSGRLLS
jgi:Predicted EndoIII-related endonuclease